MCPRRMAHDQHLVHVRLQRLHDCVAKFGHTGFKRGRVCPPGCSPEGVVVHKIIGVKLAIMLFEPPQHLPTKAHTKGGDDALEPRGPAKEGQRGVQKLARKYSDQQLQQQHPHRIERRDHRPLAQLHQPPQRSRGDIHPRRLHQLSIGRED